MRDEGNVLDLTPLIPELACSFLSDSRTFDDRHVLSDLSQELLKSFSRAWDASLAGFRHQDLDVDCLVIFPAVANLKVLHLHIVQASTANEANTTLNRIQIN